MGFTVNNFNKGPRGKKKRRFSCSPQDHSGQSELARLGWLKERRPVSTARHSNAKTETPFGIQIQYAYESPFRIVAILPFPIIKAEDDDGV